MPDGPRITAQTLKVLSVLMENPTKPFHGFDLVKPTKLATGTLYPILVRLEEAGWLTSEWESIDESAEGRRRRRIYKLTGHGAAAALDALREHLEAVRLPTRATRPVRRPGLVLRGAM